MNRRKAHLRKQIEGGFFLFQRQKHFKSLQCQKMSFEKIALHLERLPDVTKCR